MKNIKLSDLNPATRKALRADPAVIAAGEPLRVYVPHAAPVADPDAVKGVWCFLVSTLTRGPTTATAQRFNITARRVRQLTESLRNGSEPWRGALARPVDLDQLDDDTKRAPAGPERREENQAKHKLTQLEMIARGIDAATLKSNKNNGESGS